MIKLLEKHNQINEQNKEKNDEAQKYQELL